MSVFVSLKVAAFLLRDGLQDTLLGFHAKSVWLCLSAPVFFH